MLRNLVYALATWLLAVIGWAVLQLFRITAQDLGDAPIDGINPFTMASSLADVLGVLVWAIPIVSVALIVWRSLPDSVRLGD